MQQEANCFGVSHLFGPFMLNWFPFFKTSNPFWGGCSSSIFWWTCVKLICSQGFFLCQFTFGHYIVLHGFFLFIFSFPLSMTLISLNLSLFFFPQLAFVGLVVQPHKCRNPTLAKCGGEAQHLEKVRIWSPPGLLNVQSSTARPKTPRIEVFLVSLKRS